MKESVARFEQALLSIDRLTAKEILLELSKDFSPVQIVDKLIPPALERIGSGWEKGSVSLSQVYMSGRICEELVNIILPTNTYTLKNQLKMAIAVLEDHHILGKRIVCSMLHASGFTLLDYGHGIKADELVSRAVKDGIEILLISTLMLQSALRVKLVKERLDESGAEIKVVVGGAPFLFDNQLWKEVGADAFGRNASEAVTIVTRMIKNKHNATEAATKSPLEVGQASPIVI